MRHGFSKAWPGGRRRRAACGVLLAAAVVLAGAGVARAQVAYFGKNKLQYKDFEWRVLRTPHFDIHFTDGYRDLAARTGVIFEFGYAKLSNDFGHQIAWRIPVIIYGSQSDFQQTNVTWSMLPEGVLAFSEPMRRRVVHHFAGSGVEYKNTAVHELVHIFTFDIVYGNLLKSVFSRSRLFNIPLWYAEGVAEYYSVGWEESGDMFMRDASVFDYLPDLDYAGGYMAYKAGQSAIRYINDTYGPGKVVEIMEMLRGGSLPNAIESSLGITTQELSRDWKKEMRRRYWPLYSDKREPEAYGRRLTDHLKGHHFMNVKPVFAPDGEQFVFFSDRKGLDAIYLMNALSGKVEKKLLSGQMSSRFESLRSMNSSLTYSPDGSRIAFVAKSKGFDKLFILSVPEGKVLEERAMPFDFFHSPAWRPDGASIALVGVLRGRTDLYRYDIAADSLSRLTDDAADETNPAWFSDGRRLAYSRTEASSIEPIFEKDSTGVDRLAGIDFKRQANVLEVTSDIWSVDTETGETAPLISTPGEDTNPFVLPGGSEILFTSDVTGISNLYRGTLETGASRRITDVLGGVFSFSYSPARDRLVMSAFYEAGFDLFMIDEFTRKEGGFSTGLDGAPATAEAPTQGEVSPVAVAVPRADSAAVDSSAAIDSSAAAAEMEPETFVEPPAVSASGSFEASGPALSSPPPIRFPFPDSAAGAAPPDVVVDEDSDEDIDPDSLVVIRARLAREVGTIQPYRFKLAPDYVSDMSSVYFISGYGFGLVNQMSFSDLLGDHHLNIGFNLNQSIEDSDVNVTYYYVKKRIDYAIGAFQYKNYMSSRVSSVGETFQDYQLFTERNYGLYGLMSYPISTFSRVDLEFEGFISEREFFGRYDYYQGEYVFTPPRKSTRYVLQPGLSLVHDSAYYGQFGPVIGTRWLASAVRSLPLTDQSIDRFTYYYDYRRYQPVFYRNYLVFRSMGGVSEGREKRFFYLGGPTTLRGYEYLQFSSSHMLLFVAEYRLPVVDAIIFGWPGRWGLMDIGGALFFDTGAVWGDQTYVAPLPRVRARRVGDAPFFSDFGFGFHMRLGYIILNFQWAWPTDFNRVGDEMFQFYIGPLL